MKIRKLFFKNIYGIKEAEIQPGDITIFEGSNEVGKTSFLDAIKTLFTNQGIRSRVIHNGESEAELLVELDNGTVVDRKKRAEKSDFIRVSSGKDVIGSPEGYLKSLFSGNQFNPIKDFIELGAKGQKKVLLSLCNINFTEEDYIKNFGELPQDYDLDRHVLENLEAIQSKNGFYYLEREKLNRDRRAKENVRDEILETLPKDYDPEKWRNIALSELYNKVTETTKNNQDILKTQEFIAGADDKSKAINDKYDLQVKEQGELLEFKISIAKQHIEEQKQGIKDEIAGINLEIEKHEQHITELLKEIEREKRLISEFQQEIKLKEKDLDNFDNSILTTKTESLTNEMNIAVKSINENRKQELYALEEKFWQASEYLSTHSIIDVEPLQKAADHAEAMKNYIREADRVDGLNGEILGLKNKSDEFTRKIELARSLPEMLLRTAEMPVPGISIRDGELEIDGLPLDNLSEGRQMEIALEVAKAKAGELKVILVDGFEKLSQQRRDKFIKKAKETGLQYFITRVTDDESLNITEL